MNRRHSARPATRRERERRQAVIGGWLAVIASLAALAGLIAGAAWIDARQGVSVSASLAAYGL